ncbi:MAG: P-II family nitrogen regulator [bacterium]
MTNSPSPGEYQLLYIIVNCGLGSKVIRYAKEQGLTTGATVIIGKGTVNDRLLEFLGLTEIRKEIVIMVTERAKAFRALEEIGRKFQFHKPHTGIGFCIAVKYFFRGLKHPGENLEESRGEEESMSEDTMYDAIFVIVDRGKAEAVIDAATKAGSKGGTIIHARGSGIHETSKLFAMEIEPEKEVVLILAEKNLTDPIVSTIREELQIDKPGKGIIFIQAVDRAYGLYK